MDIDGSEAPGTITSHYVDLLDAIHNVDVKRTQHLLESWVEQPLKIRDKYNYASVAAVSDHTLPVLKVILEHVKTIDENHEAYSSTRRRIQEAFSKAVEFGNIPGITLMFEMDWGKCPQSYHIHTAIINAAQSWRPEPIIHIVRLSREQPEKVWPRKDLDLKPGLKKGLEAAVTSPVGKDPLSHRLKENLSALLVAGADAHAQESNGDTLLHYACKVERHRSENLKANAIEMLLQPSFPFRNLLWVSNKSGQIPIFAATESATEDILARMVAETGSLNEIRDHNGNTPLHFAKSRGIATHLFHYGCDFGVKNQNGETALHLRSCGGTVEVVKYIIDMSAVLSLPNYSSKLKWDRQGLESSIATRYEVGNKLRSMSDSDISKLNVNLVVNARTNRGWTPLMYASELDVFEYLYTRGASLTARTGLGWKILHLAVDRLDSGIVRFILDRMHVLDLKKALMAPVRSDKYRNTRTDHRGKREHKFRGGENPWIDNEIPLHWAVSWWSSTVEMLLEKARELSILNVMLEARDSNGATPLIRAISMDGYDTKNIVRVLIANGASLNARDNKGRDRHWWAKKRRYYFTKRDELRKIPFYFRYHSWWSANLRPCGPYIES